MNLINKKKISIITVVKNGMPFLKDAISSVKNQSLNGIEHIIVFSPSKDGTERFLNSQKDKIKIIKDNKSKNKFGSINLAITQSKGELVGLLHSDDVYPNNKTLEIVYRLFKKNNPDIIYGNIKYCEKKNIKKILRLWISKDFNYNLLKYGWMPPHTSMYIKKSVIKKNLYSLNYPISGDYDFILRLMLNKRLSKKYLNKILCIMRIGGDSTKLNKIFDKLIEDLSISKKYFKNNYFVIICKILRKLNQFF